MNTILKNGYLALLLVFATTLTVSAQIKPSKKKTTTTPTEQTDKPTTESENTDTKPSTSTKKKTAAKKTDQYFDESGGFKHRLWYGGNFNLNFGGDGQNFNSFTFGLTPMIGYKIIGNLSAGPRIGFNYTKVKVFEINSTIVENLTDYTVGGFARYKVFQNFFGHVEANYQSERILGTPTQPNYIIKNPDNKLYTFRRNTANYYGGVGYNSGGLLGYEIMALYNFGVTKDDRRSPLDIRFGFTYNF